MSDKYEVLKQPVMTELTETERKIKNNLIAFSFIAIFMHYGRLSISPESTMLGLRFDGLSQDKIYLCFFMLVAYSSIHYFWCVKDAFKNWKLRLTTIMEIEPGDWGSLYHVQRLDDKRNNTIYHWWAFQYKTFTDKLFLNDSLVASIKELEESISHDINLGFVENVNMLCSRLDSASSAAGKASRDTEELIKLLTDTPFKDVLPNFNSSFRSFLISQNLRWLVFECIIPFGLAGLSLYCLFPKVFQYLS
ncbi:hypothetical protein ACK366_09005 [Aeromonas veronii]